ncbi:hypothetical protein EVAR_53173_1 [Eumeta japonica]|uniref:DDE Tnp4 domain-containing protein n=2 Tax=Eumeta variegata TaxID=151549 RepID=A0A4C1YYL3_EUMVA|nr:hypothetical protein EVAR_53173_1 [Eumeta japonica]
MEPGFVKANSSNLPRIDLLMLGEFLATNKEFCSSEFRNVKTSLSSRPSYGDDAISYVQLKREGNICTVKCKICPEHKVHAKLYAVTLIVDEEEEKVTSIQCHDCVAAQVDLINEIEAETRNQFKNNLWYELRYDRVTASKVYEVSRCQTGDGTLISIIMGGKIPDTPAMKRGRYLENEQCVDPPRALDLSNNTRKALKPQGAACGCRIDSTHTVVPFAVRSHLAVSHCWAHHRPVSIRGDSFRTNAFSYRFGHSTVQSIILEICGAINEVLLTEYIPTPSQGKWLQIADELWSMWDFPNCLEALAGKYVTIEAPANSRSLYFNYKKTFSVVLLALVDANYKFVAVDIGSHGKKSDGGIFANSGKKAGKCNVEYSNRLAYIGDEHKSTARNIGR